MKPLSESIRFKAPNKGAWYKVCSVCDKELRAEQEEEEEEEVCEYPPACLTAAEGASGCLCESGPKQAAPSGKRRKSFYTSPKQERRNARSYKEGDQ